MRLTGGLRPNGVSVSFCADDYPIRRLLPLSKSKKTGSRLPTRYALLQRPEKNTFSYLPIPRHLLTFPRDRSNNGHNENC